MKEARFVALNKDKWNRMKEWESLDSDTLAGNFMELSEDLAYARTFYPGGDTERFLNQLMAGYQAHVNGGRVERKSGLLAFWKVDFPLLLAQRHKVLLFAFLVFGVSLILGVFSSAHDMGFVRSILGDGYVDMTLENIKSGKPMGVYASMNEWDMFAQITTNNIRVSFNAFILGLLFSAGSVWILFSNGLMLGVFNYLFYQHGLLSHSLWSLWAHGTFEITAIIIAGGAGIVMGNGFLFPGTYTRLYSFRRGALAGGKMVAGLIPFFIIAGWIESFVTRYADQYPAVGAACVIFSLLVIGVYFVAYPWWLYRKCSNLNS